MRNMLNVKYRHVDKQQIKHVSLSVQATLLFSFIISFLFFFFAFNVELQWVVSRLTCYLYSFQLVNERRYES